MLTINKKTLTIAISAAIVATGASTVHAAGFQLKEQSAEGQGNSFAGQTAKAVDASTIFFNPAGMARLNGNHVQSNLSFIAPEAKYKHGASTAVGGLFPKSTGIDGGESAIVPAAYAVWDYSEKVNFGLSINAPFGMSTKYDEDWVGAQYNVLSEIKTVNIAPSISYKVDDRLSIGGNIQFQKIEGKLTNKSVTGVGTAALTTLEADDTGYGYSLGLLYEYSDKGRVGFSYRSQIKHNLEGKVSTVGVSEFDASANVTLPAVASIGLYQEVSDKWTVLADVSWTDWSVFDKLEVVRSSTGAVATTTEYHWDDTVFAALGANYQYNDKLQLKFGVAYDQGAANNNDRTAGIPDETRYWASVGASYKLNKQTTFNIGYSRVEADTAKVSEDSKQNTPVAGLGSTYNGEFDPSVDILTIGINYQF
jgi:long-chain fatty acid transport protein